MTGDVNFSSNDLDFTQNWTIGLRYFVCLPAGATVLDATLTFTADEADVLPTLAQIAGEASGDAAPFSNDAPPSGRVATNEVVVWPSVLPWEVGTVETTPDLAPIVSEIVTSPDWDPDGDGCSWLVFLINGSGDREAVSFDNNPDQAALLEITYQP